MWIINQDITNMIIILMIYFTALSFAESILKINSSAYQPVDKLLGSHECKNVQLFGKFYNKKKPINSKTNLPRKRTPRKLIDVYDYFDRTIRNETQNYNTFQEDNHDQANHNEAQLENYIPQPPKRNEASYDLLVLLKGLPWKIDKRRIIEWAEPIKVNLDNIVFIHDNQNSFTGDAYLRFNDPYEKERALQDLPLKHLRNRYIQVFSANPFEYEEFFQMGYKNQANCRNYVSPKLVVAEDNSLDISEPIFTNELKCGMKMMGKVTSVHHFGSFIDANIHCKFSNGKSKRIFGLLRRSNLTSNIGLCCQDEEWKSKKELILYPGLNIYLYVLSIDQEDGALPKISFTLDASITDQKLQWWKNHQKSKIQA